MNVLIVEDDPLIARLNAGYLARVPGTTLVGQCRDVVSARGLLTQESVDLVLLDVYLGRRDGLDLAAWLREHSPGTDIILITAANEADTVRQAHRLGVSDYLVKPFTIARFIEAVSACRRRRQTWASEQRQLDQSELDTLFRGREETSAATAPRLPKGLSVPTLTTVVNAINTLEDDTFSTDTLARAAGMSRVSARKYLRYLVAEQAISENVAYGGTGRPAFVYRLVDAALLARLIESES